MRCNIAQTRANKLLDMLDNALNVWHDFNVCNLFRRQLMAITAHLAELAEKHRALEERIGQALRNPELTTSRSGG